MQKFSGSFFICNFLIQFEILKKLKSPPRTAMEVFDMLPEGTLADVIDNVLYIHPSRTVSHQLVLGDVLTEILSQVRAKNLGKCVTWVDVYLDDNNAAQPDILFIAKENLNIVQKGKVKGVPDLIAEVLSGDKKHDLERKKNLYEEFGVKEYFIVDQANKDVITYYYDDGKFVLQESENGKLKSGLLNKIFTI